MLTCQKKPCECKLVITPITLEEARYFVSTHHRHSKAAHAWKFGVGLAHECNRKNLLGVGTAGRPSARNQQDGRTLELTRVCVLDNMTNANSIIYGALIRAGRALGYTRFITYSLQSESGASLRAVGFKLSHFLDGRVWQGLNIYRGNVYTRDLDPILHDRACWELSYEPVLTQLKLI